MMETEKNTQGSQHPDSTVKKPSWKRALIHGLIGSGLFVVVVLVISIVGFISKSSGEPYQFGYKIGYAVGQALVPVFIGITALSYLVQKLIFK
jgi:hypothetical protein